MSKPSLVEQLRSLAAYDAWATDRILARVAELTPEQLAADVGTSHGSVLVNLGHTARAQALWVSWWTDEPPYEGAMAYPPADLAAVRESFRVVGERLRSFLAALTDDELDRVVVYHPLRGGTRQGRLVDQILHVVNHGTQHRSETAMALTALGHSPGEIDYVFFTLERAG